MEAQTLKAEVRNESGKGPARQLRMRGLIPAVFYGPDKKPQNLTVDPAEVTKALSGPHGRNQIVNLDFGNGKQELAIVRDLDVEPLSRQPRHADFYSVSLDRPIHAKVPFLTTGRAKGVAEGGVLHKIYRELPVFGPPDAFPADLTVDVTPLELHAAVKVKDLPLPKGVSISLDPERNVVLIASKEKEVVEEGDAAAAAATDPKAAAAAKDTKKK